MSSNGVEVTIVLPTYNRSDHLEKALTYFGKQSYDKSKFEVIVVDDFSTDDTEEMVKSFAQSASFKITCVKSDSKGQTMARNRGFKLAQSKIVISTDSDIEAAPDWIENGVKHFEDPEIYAVEGRVIMTGKLLPFMHGLENEEGGTYQTANMFYRKNALEKAGYLDENLNRWWNYGSDYDLALRVMDLGGRIVFARDAAVYHPVFKLSAYSMLRNSFKSGAIPYLYKKHKDKLPYHLKMSYRRVFAAICTVGFFISILTANLLIAIVFFVLTMYAGIKLIPQFSEAKPSVRVKAFLVYTIGATMNLFAFLASCIRLRVFPRKRMFRL